MQGNKEQKRKNESPEGPADRIWSAQATDEEDAPERKEKPGSRVAVPKTDWKVFCFAKRALDKFYVDFEENMEASRIQEKSVCKKKILEPTRRDQTRVKRQISGCSRIEEGGGGVRIREIQQWINGVFP